MNLEYKSTILSSLRNLKIDEDLNLIDSDSRGDNPVFFVKNDITGFRFGISWITGYQFTIGRVYSIDIRNRENKIITLKLRSIYGIRKEQLGNKYSEILDTIFETYFKDIYTGYLDLLNKNEVVRIESVTISNDGIVVKETSELIGWEDLEVSIAYHYLSLTSKQNRKNYTQLYFLKDWNTYLIQLIVDRMQKMKNHG